MGKRLKLYLLIPSIIVLGFIRDYLFENINWVYLTHTTQRRNQARPEFHFLLDWTPDQILNLKWFGTVLFYLLFLGLTLLIIHLAFKNRTFNFITLGMFAGLFGISGLLYIAGWVSGYGNQLYGAIHTIMMIAQSFVPLMILAILFNFLPSSQSD